MKQWTIHPLERSLGAHAPAWDELARRTRHPMLSANFIERLLQCFGDGQECLCRLDEGGKVLAMLVLRPRNALVWASFLPVQMEVGPTLVGDAATLDSLWQALPPMVQRLDLLNNDPATTGLLGSLPVGAYRRPHALTMQVALDGSFADYWAARHRHLQQNMRRYERRIQDDGHAMRVVTLGDPAQVEAAVRRYADLEAASWKGAAGTALDADPDQLRFYTELMTDAAARGDGTVHELWLDERLAASRIVLRDGSALVMLKTTYDEALAQYAPGRVLLHRVLAWAFASASARWVEFGTDANAELLAWATSQRWVQHLIRFRHGGSKLLHVLKRALRSAGQRDQDDRVQVEAVAGLDALPWDAVRLLEQSERDSLSFGYSWYRNLCDTVFRDASQVRFYILRRGTEVRAVLPLLAEPALGGRRLRTLGNFYTALYQPALAVNIKPAELTRALAFIRAEHGATSALTLAPMDPASHGFMVLMSALRMEGWFTFAYYCFGNWYQPVDCDWSTYLARRPGELRSTLKRMGKKFAAQGGSFTILRTPADVSRGLADYEQVYAGSWKMPEPFSDFMPGLLGNYAGKGMVRLGLAHLQGQPVAAQVWLLGHGRAEIYKLAYHDQYRSFAPGTLLTAEMMRQAFEEPGMREIDYLIGDDHYKQQWMSHRRERWGLVAYNPGTAAGLAGALRDTAAMLTQRWRRSRPAVEQPDDKLGDALSAPQR